MDVHLFDFDLPDELIAQEPAAAPTAGRLLCLDRRSGTLAHSTVASLPTLLRAGDLVVVNNTRVFPARLLGRRVPSGGAVECLLIRDIGDGLWQALMHPGQKLRPGAEVVFERDGRVVHGRVEARLFHGRRTIRLWTDDETSIDAAVDAIGHVPLPPYIARADRPDDRERYQTVFARMRGSVAAPTAGLHFDAALLKALRGQGVDVVEITLHVGYGTFQPVRVERVEDHRLEAETYAIDETAAVTINRALNQGRRVVAVGTTTTRTLETVAAANGGRIVPGSGESGLFIYPGFDFRVISGLVTNFHLPRSSLLMLVAAFAGTASVMDAYRTAVAERYRFYSYGDAMLIV